MAKLKTLGENILAIGSIERILPNPNLMGSRSSQN